MWCLTRLELSFCFCCLFGHFFVMWLEYRFLDTEVDSSNPGISMLCPWARNFIRVATVDSAVKWVPGGDNLVKGVQCYELFRGIALKNHAFVVSQSRWQLLRLNDARHHGLLQCLTSILGTFCSRTVIRCWHTDAVTVWTDDRCINRASWLKERDVRWGTFCDLLCSIFRGSSLCGQWIVHHAGQSLVDDSPPFWKHVLPIGAGTSIA